VAAAGSTKMLLSVYKNTQRADPEDHNGVLRLENLSYNFLRFILLNTLIAGTVTDKMKNPIRKALS
jgi:hypothetical protein